MSPEHWKQVKELFHAALALPPAERASFLDKACSGRETLRREVQSLLDSHERTGDFIDSPAFEVGAHLLTKDTESLEDGLVVSDYKIIKRIGRGGMGEVYLAKDQRLGRNVALKVLPKHLNEFTDRLRRFETEACAASALNHPNILTIYGICQTESRHYIITEYIEGETLRAHIPAKGMGIIEALEIIIQVTSALATAHEAGIIHRDIKPDNIMIRRDQLVKVLDFGLAKLALDSRGSDEDVETRPLFKTESGVVMGTVQYMSPEQARGLVVDARTDIWSLGCVLYEMLAGCTPFKGETNSHTIVSILEDETPPLKDFRADVPAELEWIVIKALRKDRDERYQTTKELLGDLKDLKHKLEFRAELERSVSTKAGYEPRKERSEELDEKRDEAAVETIRIVTPRTTSSIDEISRSIRRNWRWALVVLAVPSIAALVVFAGYRYWNARRIEPAAQPNSNTARAPLTLKTSQVTSWAGVDIFPSFSPDGNSIAYSSDHNGSFEIYVKQLTPGGREIQLTSDGQQNIQPVWSPDGKLIAFHSDRRGGIWVMPALGGAAKQLTDFGSRPAFSPDGSLIAFQSRSTFDLQTNSPGVAPPSTIWTVGVAGDSAKQITKDGTPPGGHGAPCWSPDGRRIVFVAVELGSIYAQLWTVERDGGEPKPVSTNPKRPALGYDPIYAPDGKSLYYSGAAGGRGWNLVKLPVSPDTGQATGVPVVIKETAWTIFKNNQISADGKRLISSADEMTSNLFSIQLSQAGEATSAPVAITQDTTFRKSSPSFSPDGKRIAYQKFIPGGFHDIWLMDADGKNQTQLTTDPGSEVFPSWFPQGDKLAFLYNETNSRSGPISLRSIDIQTGREEEILRLNQDIAFPQLSPDGKTFAFNSTDKGVTNIWTVQLDGSQLKQLTFSKDSMGFPHWSPDSQLIIFEDRQGDSSQLMVIPRDGGEPKPLTSGAGQRFTGGWSPDGGKISFAKYLDGVWNIWWVTRDGKTEKQITNNTKLNVFIRYPIWSPLGNQMVFEYTEVKGNIWITDLE